MAQYLKRKNVTNKNEVPYVPAYDIYYKEQLVGRVHCTGRPGVDNYPWEASWTGGLNLPLVEAQETLRACIDCMEHLFINTK
jgi:hypothetical protein